MSYNTYYLRCIAADYDNMIQLGVLLGALQVTDGIVTATNGGCYDLVGTIHKPTGETVETEFGSQPVMVPRCDPDGNPYVHANLITPVNLREAAEALAAARPEIAAGLADLSKYFVTDADGNAVAPAQPHRVFST